MNIIQACRDPKVFGPFFKGKTWDAWLVFLCALFALPMTPEQLQVYQKHTGRTTPPTSPIFEAWLCCGRRSGKSFILALCAVFLASFTDWRRFLGPGEVGTIMVICADRRQARTIMRYCLGLIKAVPMLAQLIESETRESITLRNRIVIEVHTASFRSTRGYTCVAALLDEVAYWPVDESAAEVDVEVLNAIRPSMATIPGAMLLCASSPHARKGALWTAYSKHFGKDGDPVLVWQASTRDMNASVPQSFIDQHMAEDPARAQAEYMAQFRSDLEGYVLREAVEACVNTGIRERAPQRGIVYTGFVDPSGGSVDSMTLAIAHRDQDVVVIDALRERVPPFSPEQVVGEFAELLKSYNVTRITGDRFANIWPVEVFANVGIGYEQSAEPKSVLYTNMLPLLNSCRIELLDHSKTINQLIALERRTARGGRESIDHPPGGHDDLINAVAGAAVGAPSEPDGAYIHRLMGDDDPDGSKAWRAMRLMEHIQRYG